MIGGGHAGCLLCVESWRGEFHVSAENSFERTLAALHGAALDDARWLSAAALVNEACRVRGHALLFVEGSSVQDGRAFLMRFCYGRERREDWERTYLRDYLEHDPRVRRVAEIPDGGSMHTGALFTEGEKRTSALYNELLREMQAQDGLNVHLLAPAGSHIGWIFADSTERGGWSSDQIRVVERLQPHIRQFTLVRHALLDAGALGASLYGLLDNTGICVMQLDRRGKIIEANDRARDMLQRREALFAPGGFLRAVRTEENVDLHRLLAASMPDFAAQGVGGSMTIGGSLRARTWIVHVHPVGAELTDSHTRRVAALVLAVSPASPIWIDSDLVALALGLTDTESRLAAMLAAGHSVDDMALATGRKKPTIRWHLSQIFRKHNIARQAELVRRVLSLQLVNERRHRAQDRPPESG